METEIIVAIITGCATIIAGVVALITKEAKGKEEQKIQGNGNIQAGKNVNISGGVTIHAETNNKRK